MTRIALLASILATVLVLSGCGGHKRSTRQYLDAGTTAGGALDGAWPQIG